MAVVVCEVMMLVEDGLGGIHVMVGCAGLGEMWFGKRDCRQP